MSRFLEKKDWDLLLPRIDEGTVIPILGAGAVDGAAPIGYADPPGWTKRYPYPGGSRLAEEWARDYDYPLPDSAQLERVAQFLTVDRDQRFPKEQIQKLLDEPTYPDFSLVNEPHAVLASLPLPLYFTTNYDDFLFQAMRLRKRDAKRIVCDWNRYITDKTMLFDRRWQPKVATPLVFHLHGASNLPESLVLTEDDHMEFIVNLSKRSPKLPAKIEGHIAKSSLLFLGYKLSDWDFRTIFRIMVDYLRNSLSGIHVAVQLDPGDPPPTSDDEKKKIQKAEEYLKSYFQKTADIRIYLGTCQGFVAELWERWTTYGGSKDDKRGN